MAGLPLAALDPLLGAEVVVGTETGDDAAVVRLPGGDGLVVTADFITPPLDDPRAFGAIAAANSLSDVYAMGGRPLVALALCAFPKELDPDVAREILAGGQAKVAEAGAAIVGGHTVRSPELLYGLSVTGLVPPGSALRNVGARPGDALVLTKALGTGLVVNGRRKGVAPDAVVDAAVQQMERLNREPALAAIEAGAHAATDVTGFGLSGHALKMALGSGVTLRLFADALPVIPGALALAAQGITTAATKANRAQAAAHLRSAAEIPPLLDQVLHDPQTSGGLLMAVPASSVRALARRLEDAGHLAAVVGEVVAGAPGIEVAGGFERFA